MAGCAACLPVSQWRLSYALRIITYRNEYRDDRGACVLSLQSVDTRVTTDASLRYVSHSRLIMQLLPCARLMESNQSRRTHVVDVRRRTCDVARKQSRVPTSELILDNFLRLLSVVHTTRLV